MKKIISQERIFIKKNIVFFTKNNVFL